jgi:hypothetical protein
MEHGWKIAATVGMVTHPSIDCRIHIADAGHQS